MTPGEGEAIVVQGPLRRRVSFGPTFVKPIIERHMRLDLSPRTIAVAMKAHTKDHAGVRLTAEVSLVVPRQQEAVGRIVDRWPSSTLHEEERFAEALGPIVRESLMAVTAAADLERLLGQPTDLEDHVSVLLQERLGGFQVERIAVELLEPLAVRDLDEMQLPDTQGRVALLQRQLEARRAAAKTEADKRLEPLRARVAELEDQLAALRAKHGK